MNIMKLAKNHIKIIIMISQKMCLSPSSTTNPQLWPPLDSFIFEIL